MKDDRLAATHGTLTALMTAVLRADVEDLKRALTRAQFDTLIAALAAARVTALVNLMQHEDALEAENAGAAKFTRLACGLDTDDDPLHALLESAHMMTLATKVMDAHADEDERDEREEHVEEQFGDTSAEDELLMWRDAMKQEEGRRGDD